MTLFSGILLALTVVPFYAWGVTERPALAYAKAFGGSDGDTITAVAADSSGNSYLAGSTTSIDFPVAGGFQNHLAGFSLRLSTDNGTSWSTPGIRESAVTAVAGSPVQPDLLFAGTSAGLRRSTDAGKTWAPCGSQLRTWVQQVIPDTTDPNVVYLNTRFGIFKSQDACSTWTNLNQGGLAGFAYLFASPGQPIALFALINSTVLYRSTDGGTNWTPLPAVSDFFPQASVFDPANPAVIYTIGRQGFYRSADLGTTWTKIGSTFPGGGYYPNSLALSATGFYIGADNGVFRSTDNGNTWMPTSISARTPTVLADPGNPGIVYASADRIYRSTDAGVSWSALATGVAETVQTLAVVATKPISVFAGYIVPSDVFLTKLGPDGHRILYSTYLGGSGYDYPTGIAVDRSGNAYVTGYTYSADFPITHGAIQSKLAGPYNAFLAKISPDGGTLLYSTYLGGSTGDSANGIALDAAGNVYLTGWAGSADFPLTSNAVQSQIRQGCSTPPALLAQNPSYVSPNHGDAFVIKMSSDGTLLYSTFLGGDCADEGMGIAVDSEGSAYVAGITYSPDFPVTSGSYQTVFQSAPNSGFLAKLSPQGSAVVYATFVGGRFSDVAEAVAVDGAGNAYVTGASYQLDSALDPNATCSSGHAYYQTLGTDFGINSGGCAYVVKLNPAGSSLLSVKYLGRAYTTGTNIAVDPSGHIWVAGTSGRTVTFPTGIIMHGPADFIASVPTVHPFQGGQLGYGFVAELSPDAGTVLFSSLLDYELGMALDPTGNVYVAGATREVDFPKEVFNNGCPPPNACIVVPTSAFAIRIDAAVNAALTIEEPQNPLAPGAMTTILGDGFGPDQQGITVTFDGISAPLLSVQPQKIVCMAPFELDSHAEVTVQVSNQTSASNRIRLPVYKSALQVLALANQDGSANSSSHPAAASSVVTAYVTGMGQTDPPSVDGQITTGGAGVFVSAVQVLFNGDDRNPLVVLYAGAAPGQMSGFGQINVVLPPLHPGQYFLAFVYTDSRTGFRKYIDVPLFVG